MWILGNFNHLVGFVTLFLDEEGKTEDHTISWHHSLFLLSTDLFIEGKNLE